MEADVACEEVLEEDRGHHAAPLPRIEQHVIRKLRTNTRYNANISGRKTRRGIGVAENRFQVGGNRPGTRRRGRVSTWLGAGRGRTRRGYRDGRVECATSGVPGDVDDQQTPSTAPTR